jgi:osmotically-inducible protein OsmY
MTRRITAKVKTAIMAEPGLKATEINVDTKDAVVTLTGPFLPRRSRTARRRLPTSFSA